MNKYPAQSRRAQRKRHQAQMCDRKTSYDTRAAALIEIPRNQYTYHCPYCHKWHRSGAVERLARVARKFKR